MIHPHTRLAPIDDQIGVGVVATRFIPAGTIVWALDALDQRVSRAAAARMDPLLQAQLDRYAYSASEEDDYVLCWDHARFINHSCDATCLGGEFAFEVAVRDIHEGEQLTDDYGTFGAEWAMTCRCGSPLCRGVIAGTDAERMQPVWDARFRAVLPLVAQVHQPLWSLVSDKDALMQAIAEETAPRRHAAALRA